MADQYLGTSWYRDYDYVVVEDYPDPSLFKPGAWFRIEPDDPEDVDDLGPHRIESVRHYTGGKRSVQVTVATYEERGCGWLPYGKLFLCDPPNPWEHRGELMRFARGWRERWRLTREIALTRDDSDLFRAADENVTAADAAVRMLEEGS